MANGDGTKDVAQVLKRSPVEAADSPQMPGTGWLLYLTMPTPEGFPQWGADVKKRDKMLRDFIVKESFFASALATVQGRNAAMRWTVTGSPRTSEVYKHILLEANFGAGWQDFIAAFSEDLYTQDSGAFVAPIHATDSEDSPVIGIHTLDAARCYPTGDAEYPVIYIDRKNAYHRLRPFEIVQCLELAASVEHAAAGPLYRLQRCALTRFLETALRMRNQAVYMKEKTGGRFQKAIHLVQGVPAQKIEDAIKSKEEKADAQGLLSFIEHTVIGGVDAETPIEVKTIELAGLPDGFDEDKWLKAYYIALALAFMTDPQEFAPLPGGGLGTSTQAEMLHMKSRGKAPALFQALVSNLINWHVFPDAVEFTWQERDLVAEMDQAQADKARAERYKLLVESGVLTPEAVRQMMVDSGELPDEILQMLGASDVTPERSTDAESKPEQEDEAASQQEEKERATGRAGPDEARLELEATVAEPIALALKRIERNVRKRLAEAEV